MPSNSTTTLAGVAFYHANLCSKGNKSFNATANLIKQKPGYSKLSRQILKEWVAAAAAPTRPSGVPGVLVLTTISKKRGKEPCWLFERAVLRRLMYCVLVAAEQRAAAECLEDTKRRRVASTFRTVAVRVIASGVWSYEIVRQAALRTQASAEFAGTTRVQELKFSDTWVKAFLDRCGLRKKRATAVSLQLSLCSSACSSAPPLTPPSPPPLFIHSLPLTHAAHQGRQAPCRRGAACDGGHPTKGR